MSISFYADGDTGEDPFVNLANLNALEAMAHLGIEADYCGSIDATDLASRLPRLAALSPLPDRDIVNVHPGGVTVIECGHPEGYWQDVAQRLLVVCGRAISKGVEVTWA